MINFSQMEIKNKKQNNTFALASERYKTYYSVCRRDAPVARITVNKINIEMEN
jgi:hypothetical protein